MRLPDDFWAKEIIVLRKGLQIEIPNSNSAIGDLALREINHRVANTLTMLSAGIRSHFRHVEDPRLRMALKRHESQILGIGELHRLLGTQPVAAGCDISDYFQTVCNALVRSVLAPLDLRCEVLLSDGVLPAAACTKLGMVISELVMNSAKHAFRDSEGGRLRIQVLREGDYCHCLVSDNGVGLGLRAGGAGTGIVSQLVREVGGILRARSGSWGTDVSVVFPIQ